MDAYFTHIFIVNLRNRTDRRAEMEQQLRKAGVTTAQFFDAFQFAHAEPFHRVGSRGSYMSHLAILKQCISAPNVCMLQDDVNFSPDFKVRQTTIGSLPTDWAIFYGGYAPTDSRANIVFPDAMNRLNPSQEFIGAHFWAVNGPAIGLLVDALETYLTRPRDSPEGGPMPIDGALNVFRKQNPNLTAYAAYPPLGYQRSSRSDCDTSNWFDTTPVVSTIVSRLRRLKNALKR